MTSIEAQKAQTKEIKSLLGGRKSGTVVRTKGKVGALVTTVTVMIEDSAKTSTALDSAKILFVRSADDNFAYFVIYSS